MKYSKTNRINYHAPSNISRFVASGLLACSLMSPSIAFSGYVVKTGHTTGVK